MTQSPVRIMHFIESAGVYGAESVLLNLSEMMVDSGRYEPIVGCIVADPDAASDLFDRACQTGLRAEKIVIRNSRLLVDVPRAARRLQQLEVQLIHSHGYKPSVFGFAISRLTGIEIMATCHLWFMDQGRPLKMRLMVAMERHLYRYFRVVIGVSQPIREVLTRSGIRPERTKVIRNGVSVQVPESLSSAARAELRRELGVGTETYCVLNTGRLTLQKAQMDLVAAAQIVRDQGIPLKVLIVGDGELREELAAKITAAKLQETVCLLGFRPDVATLLQLADLYVLPSLDEGMPMGLLEAAAAGVPVVATAVGDVPDLIIDGVTGSVVPVGDAQALARAMVLLLTEEDEAARLGRRAAERVRESYSTGAMFDQYAAIYAQLTREPV